MHVGLDVEPGFLILFFAFFLHWQPCRCGRGNCFCITLLVFLLRVVSFHFCVMTPFALDAMGVINIVCLSLSCMNIHSKLHPLLILKLKKNHVCTYVEQINFLSDP